ncbi:MAG: hybrid sensor histidine kinase/response regulator [Thermonemataceae bacterium]|nr:hybrid sensor histidine kinase/response regulator [Thermonemataceae bacterium]
MLNVNVKAMIEAAPQRKLVLYIDDEPKNLTSFKSVFRRHYEVYLAASADEGMDIMTQIPIQLVITDQRMPKVTGVEFLEKINDKFPDVSRILLTGYSDFDAIIDAINKGRIFKYVAKPWKAEELKHTIDTALELSILKKYNKELIDTLQKTNYELDRFIYRAAHDLRGPIANLLGLINLTKIEEDLHTIKHYNQLKEHTVKRMDSFIHDIVDYSGNIRLGLEKNHIDFQVVVDNVIKQNEFLPNFTKIKKEVWVEQSTEFVNDKNRLEVILNNLIRNAIRFSVDTDREPFLRVEVRSGEEKAVISVIDNGEGIEPEYQDKIFEMFFRAGDNSRDASGLGLFIVKDILAKIGGSITVESEKYKGSTFTVELPNLKNEQQ